MEIVRPTPGGKESSFMKRKPQFGKLGKKLGKGKLGSSLSSVGAMRPGAIPLMIEFGISGIKVLQLSGQSPVSISAAAFMPTPDDLLDNPSKRLLFQMDALPKFLKGEKINASRGACLIPAGQMVCKHLQLIPAEGVTSEQIAGAQLSSQLGCEQGSLLVRCRDVPGVKHQGKQEVITFGASRDFVGRLMGALKSAKLDPVGIHNEFDALSRAIQLRDDSAGGVSGSKPRLVIDMGTGSTKVMAMHGSTMVFARTIELGARHFDETICRQLRCTMIEARQMRHELTELFAKQEVGVAATGLPGLPPPSGEEDESQVSSVPTGRGPKIDLTEPIEIICDEISMCLRYHDALFPGTRVESMIFMGGQSKHNSLCAEMARRLNLEAQVFDPMACLGRSGKFPVSGVDLREAQPGWAAIVGGALSPMDL
jgi:Tfp pilus assembly PilM family ATPase